MVSRLENRSEERLTQCTTAEHKVCSGGHCVSNICQIGEGTFSASKRSLATTSKHDRQPTPIKRGLFSSLSCQLSLRETANDEDCAFVVLNTTSLACVELYKGPSTMAFLFGANRRQKQPTDIARSIKDLLRRLWNEPSNPRVGHQCLC
jgi:hypothetical protein